MAYTTASRVKITANHLNLLSDEAINIYIEDANASYMGRVRQKTSDRSKLELIERLLAQHFATLNIRRPDSQSLDGMSKSLSVPRNIGLSQTEYGQSAKSLMNELGVSTELQRISLEAL